MGMQAKDNIKYARKYIKELIKNTNAEKSTQNSGVTINDIEVSL